MEKILQYVSQVQDILESEELPETFFHHISALEALKQLRNDGLSRGNMRECAWSFIINGYSKEFLEKNYERLSLYVDMIVQANDPTKVFNLIHQSAKTFPGDPYAIPQCAEKIQCPTQVIAAKQDRIAGFEPVHQLAQHISQCEYIEMNTGHLAPFENPLVWRKHLMDFMNRD